MTYRSKISRLPRALRDELNRRLDGGEEGDSILTWLNAQPEIQSLPLRENEGRPITKQNLSDWRQGGFRHWQAHQDLLDDARELAADATKITRAADGFLTDHLAAVLTARYARLMSGWDGEVTDDFRQKLRALHKMSQDIVELRRGDHSAARLRLGQEKVDELKEWSEAELLEHFERWAGNPEVRDWVCAPSTDPAERERRLRMIFGLPGAVADGDEPASVQPGRT